MSMVTILAFTLGAKYSSIGSSRQPCHRDGVSLSQEFFLLAIPFRH